jgi:thiamine biosynthesis lipoprotein ApbE
MKYVVIKSGDKITERHPIDNDVIEWAARITAESHNMEFPDEPWTVEIEDPDAQKNAEIELE